MNLCLILADQGSGFCVTGKIEAGFLQTGDRLLAMPPNETCTVKRKKQPWQKYQSSPSNITNYYTCNSTFVIYLIKCPCGLEYVGETTQKVEDRIKQHKSNIRCNYNYLPIPSHFAEARHTVSQLRYQVIDGVGPLRCGGDRIYLLKKLEMQWILRLGTLSPGGLN
ncbi:hypothetical protein XELAEV_18029182mg [Xenopus laevis]|uniref:GIY-YIG domain-containing protein n=1 Tax=Xenopus laevis TaxID=8355 RepID=A0A974CRJ2_XENLA|nr:hypothetical protein XELAEV_18029182mg [Xenopus laevis]